MSDDAPVTPAIAVPAVPDADDNSQANSGSHKLFGGISMAFNMAIIVYLLIYGKGDNSLHTSALSWAFSIVAVVLGSFGFPAILTIIAKVRG